MRWQDFDYTKWKEEDSKYDHAGSRALFKKLWNENKSGFVGIFALFEEIDKQFGRPVFAPSVSYQKEGDLIHIYLSDSAHYAKWLRPGLSVLLDMETNEVVGFTIEGAKRMIARDEKEDEYYNDQPV